MNPPSANLRRRSTFLRSLRLLALAALAAAAVLLPRASQVRADESATRVIPLFQGNDAFAARLAAIQNAKSTIDLQSYIFHFDETGQILARELIRKASEGVKVRLSVDKVGMDPDSRKFLQDLSEAGVEVRIYNPVPLIDAHKAQYRNHQKALVVDAGRESELAIIGGRNIGDEYFSDDPDHNFIDSDLMIRGGVVSEISRNFETFWGDPQLKVLDADRSRKSRAKAQWDIPSVDTRLPPVDFNEHSSYPCTDPEYVWDRPAPPFARPISEPPSPESRLALTDPFRSRFDETRQVKSALHRFVRECEGELRIESAYFVSNPDQWKLFEDFRQRGGKLTLITNAGQASDVPIVTTRFNQQRGRLERKVDADVYQLTGQFEPSIDDAGGGAAPSEAHWGTHAKMMVCNLDDVAIGSANWDPRSLEYNTEDFLICRNSPELAARTRAAFQMRLHGDSPCSESGDPSNRAHPWRIRDVLLALPAWMFSDML